MRELVIMSTMGRKQTLEARRLLATRKVAIQHCEA